MKKNKSFTSAAVKAPARVNLIGEHTDYNGGYVLPAALGMSVAASGSSRGDGIVSVYAADIGEKTEFSLDRIEFASSSFWLNYIKGVAFYLLEAGAGLKGADILIKGDIPSGAGLSSSAALEVASALFFQKISGFEMDPVDTAKLCQRAENEFVGMNCGLMDQFACCMGKKDHAVFLDCRSLEFSHVPIARDIRIVILNTGVRRELASSEYNKRRAECELAVSLLSRELPGIKQLRDVSCDELKSLKNILPETIYRRALHVVSENRRVLDAVKALKKNDYSGFGKLLLASHASLRDDFGVSCPELDLMVELSMKAPGVYGARLTGAGFGGCAVSLVREESVGEFLETVPGQYRSRTGLEPEVYVCRAADGAGVCS